MLSITILPVLLMHGPAMIVDNGERSVIHCGQRCRHHGTSRQRENTARVIHQLQGLYWCKTGVTRTGTETGRPAIFFIIRQIL